MICDWEAMSMKFDPNNDLGTIAWYINEAEKEKSQMSAVTRKTVENVLELLYDTEIHKKEDNEVVDNGEISS